MKNLTTMTKGSVYTNLENEVLIIKSITNNTYPNQDVNGAYVVIKNAFTIGYEQWMSIDSIWNFINN